MTPISHRQITANTMATTYFTAPTRLCALPRAAVMSPAAAIATRMPGAKARESGNAAFGENADSNSRKKPRTDRRVGGHRITKRTDVLAGTQPRDRNYSFTQSPALR